MTKEEMKLQIPKGTPYCYMIDTEGKYHGCPWRKHIDTIYYNLDEINCPHNLTCNSKDICWQTPRTSCKIEVYRCEYLGYTDYEEESLLWDAVKECGEFEDE